MSMTGQDERTRDFLEAMDAFNAPTSDEAPTPKKRKQGEPASKRAFATSPATVERDRFQDVEVALEAEKQGEDALKKELEQAKEKIKIKDREMRALHVKLARTKAKLRTEKASHRRLERDISALKSQLQDRQDSRVTDQTYIIDRLLDYLSSQHGSSTGPRGDQVHHSADEN